MIGATIPPAPPDSERSAGPEPSWLEGFEASMAQFRAVDSFDAERRNLNKAKVEWARQFETVTGASFEEIRRGALQYGTGFGYEVSLDEEMLEDRLQVALAALPAEQRRQIPPRSSIPDRAREIALEDYHRAQEVRDRATGPQSFGSGFAGGTAGAMADPINLAAMALTRSPSASLLRNVLREAGVSAGVEAVQQPQVQTYRAELGLEAGLGEAAQNILFAGAGAGVFEGGSQLAGMGWRQLARRGRAAKPDDQAVEDAATILEDAADIEEANPFPPASVDGPDEVPQPVDTHERRLGQAAAAIVRGEDAGLDDTTMSAAALRGILPENEAYREFDPEQLTVDAARFQFKAGGDEYGVLDTLKGVTRWEQERADLTMAWQARDGTVYLVDGHQRHGLARRIKATDPEQRPRLLAYVLREDDGITASQARVRAAMKNIGEGSGSATDAARIFRAAAGDGNDAGDAFASLPLSKGVVQDGRGLASLSDEAFDLVARGLISERAGAAVGRVVPDRPNVQVQIAQAMERMRPVSRADADYMARELSRVPEAAEVTADLFGEEAVARLLIQERATILRGAVNQLAKDRRAFDTLVREQGRLEAEGNVLAASNNLARVNSDVQTAVQIERGANRVGNVSDALGRAAEALAGGETKRRAISQFIRDVRSGDTRGDGGRADPGGNGADRERPNQGNAGDPQGATQTELSPAGAARPTDLEDVADTLGDNGTDPITAQADSLIEELRTRATEDPSAEFVDPDTGEVRPLADLLSELDRDQGAVERLRGCVVQPA